MIAALGIIVSEVYHPFYNIPGPATEHFAAMDQYIPNFWLIPFVWTGLFEFYSINKGTLITSGHSLPFVFLTF